MRLSIAQLKSLRRKVDNFLYGFGVNVALDKAEKNKTFKRFILDLQKALKWQVEEITKPENFDRLMQVSKVEKLRIRYFENKQLEAVFNTLFADLDLGTAFQYGTENSLGFYFVWGANLGGQAAIDKLGVEGIFGVIDKAWLKHLENLENLLITGVDNTTKKWIASILQEGLENHLTDLEIRDLLMTEVKGMSKTRAETIARTEIANVMSQTELEGYKRAGIREKRWRTSRDDRVCAWCSPLDNAVVMTSRTFSSTSGKTTYTVQVPPLHPMCRCFIQAVIEAWWETSEKKVWLGD